MIGLLTDPREHGIADERQCSTHMSLNRGGGVSASSFLNGVHMKTLSHTVGHHARHLERRSANLTLSPPRPSTKKSFPAGCARFSVIRVGRNASLDDDERTYVHVTEIIHLTIRSQLLE